MTFGLIAALGFYLAAQLPNQLDRVLQAPEPIQASIHNVERYLFEVGQCTDLHPQLNLDSAYEELEMRYLDAKIEAQGVWPDIGSDGFPQYEVGTEALPECDANRVQIALQRADEALDDHALLFKKLTAHMGSETAWLGPIRLCRDNVVTTKMTHSWGSQQPALVIKLAPNYQGNLSKLTEMLINRPLPIRLDGVVVSKPLVVERIDNGEVQIAGPEREVLSRLAERSLSNC